MPYASTSRSLFSTITYKKITVVKMANTTSEGYIMSTEKQGINMWQNNSELFLKDEISVTFLLLNMVGFLANTLVIVVIVGGSLRHSVFMTLSIVLAVADNLTLLSTGLVQPGVFGHIFGQALLPCRVLAYIGQSSGAMSSWMVVLISIERVFAISYPLKVHIYFSMQRSCILILCLGVFVCIFTAYCLFSAFINTDSDIPTCVLTRPNTIGDAIYSILNGLLYRLIPFCLITILNVVILKKLKSKKAFRARSQVHSQSLSHGDRSLVPMMLAVSLVFAVTTFPFTMLIIISLILGLNGIEWNDKNNWVIVLTMGLANLYHILNFFFYCITGSVFRNAFLSLFKCKNNHHSLNSPQHVVAVSSNTL